MIELVKTKNSLKLIPDDLDALRDAEHLDEALESHTSNGWTRIDPDGCGALTDGFIITDDWDTDDLGNLTRLGTVYWDVKYQTENTLEKLQKGETVEWLAVD